MDESGFNCSPGRSPIYCKRGAKNAFCFVPNNLKQQYTVVSCINAAGDYLPPLILYKGTELGLMESWCQGGPENCVYQVSPSGWMEASTMVSWFRDCFLPFVPSGKKLLIFDGHVSHMSLRLIELARENQVALLCLPAHSSHILQPLDVGVFSHVKRDFAKINAEYQRRTGCVNISKGVFPSLFKKLGEKDHETRRQTCFKRSHAIAGFESTGKLFSIVNRILYLSI
jgi:hypothetical protein